MKSTLTVAELDFEAWCRGKGLEHRRIHEAKAPGHRRPDYGIKVLAHWCVVEVKELIETDRETAMRRELSAGAASFSWVDPGGRLRRPMKQGASQLRKFSLRGLPTLVCFLDTTVAFHLEPVHVSQAMLGRETLHFEVSSDPAHEPLFRGMRHGKQATLTEKNNTSISAVAVLRRPSGTDLLVDLHHNPHARVPIPKALAAPLVRHQFGEDAEDLDRAPSVFDLMQSAEWEEWLADPEGMCDREIEKCLREFRAAQT